MNLKERDELLIRLDVRTEGLERWTAEHDMKHKEHKVLLWKLFIASISVAGGALVKAFL